MQKTIIINGIIADKEDYKKFIKDYYWYNKIRIAFGQKPIMSIKTRQIGEILSIETEGI